MAGGAHGLKLEERSLHTPRGPEGCVRWATAVVCVQSATSVRYSQLLSFDDARGASLGFASLAADACLVASEVLSVVSQPLATRVPRRGCTLRGEPLVDRTLFETLAAQTARLALARGRRAREGDGVPAERGSSGLFREATVELTALVADWLDSGDRMRLAGTCVTAREGAVRAEAKSAHLLAAQSEMEKPRGAVDEDVACSLLRRGGNLATARAAVLLRLAGREGLWRSLRQLLAQGALPPGDPDTDPPRWLRRVWAQVLHAGELDAARALVGCRPALLRPERAGAPANLVFGADALRFLKARGALHGRAVCAQLQLLDDESMGGVFDLLLDEHAADAQGMGRAPLLVLCGKLRHAANVSAVARAARALYGPCTQPGVVASLLRVHAKGGVPATHLVDVALLAEPQLAVACTVRAFATAPEPGREMLALASCVLGKLPLLRSEGDLAVVAEACFRGAWPAGTEQRQFELRGSEAAGAAVALARCVASALGAAELRPFLGGALADALFAETSFWRVRDGDALRGEAAVAVLLVKQLLGSDASHAASAVPGAIRLGAHGFATWLVTAGGGVGGGWDEAELARAVVAAAGAPTVFGVLEALNRRGRGVCAHDDGATALLRAAMGASLALGRDGLRFLEACGAGAPHQRLRRLPAFTHVFAWGSGASLITTRELEVAAAAGEGAVVERFDLTTVEGALLRGGGPPQQRALMWALTTGPAEDAAAVSFAAQQLDVGGLVGLLDRALLDRGASLAALTSNATLGVVNALHTRVRREGGVLPMRVLERFAAALGAPPADCVGRAAWCGRGARVPLLLHLLLRLVKGGAAAPRAVVAAVFQTHDAAAIKLLTERFLCTTTAEDMDAALRMPADWSWNTVEVCAQHWGPDPWEHPATQLDVVRRVANLAGRGCKDPRLPRHRQRALLLQVLPPGRVRAAEASDLLRDLCCDGDFARLMDVRCCGRAVTDSVLQLVEEPFRPHLENGPFAAGLGAALRGLNETDPRLARRGWRSAVHVFRVLGCPAPAPAPAGAAGLAGALHSACEFAAGGDADGVRGCWAYAVTELDRGGLGGGGGGDAEVARCLELQGCGHPGSRATTDRCWAAAVLGPAILSCDALFLSSLALVLEKIRLYGRRREPPPAPILSAATWFAREAVDRARGPQTLQTLQRVVDAVLGGDAAEQFPEAAECLGDSEVQRRGLDAAACDYLDNPRTLELLLARNPRRRLFGALHAAAGRGHLAALELLLAHRGGPHAADARLPRLRGPHRRRAPCKMRAREWAAFNGAWDCVRCLAPFDFGGKPPCGLDLYELGVLGTTGGAGGGLHPVVAEHAAELHRSGAVRWHGRTLLHYAGTNRDPAALRALLALCPGWAHARTWPENQSVGDWAAATGSEQCLRQWAAAVGSEQCLRQWAAAADPPRPLHGWLRDEEPAAALPAPRRRRRRRLFTAD